MIFANPLQTGNFTGRERAARDSHPSKALKATLWQALLARFPAQKTGDEFTKTGDFVLGTG